jgi:DNA-binding Xre family transcriptional regulator
MSLAHAITQTMQAHGLKAAQVAERLGETQDRATFYRMVNGATKEPRLGTLVRLCIALDTSPSELLELAEVWSPDTPGRAGPDDLRLRQAFGQLRALPQDGKRWAAPLISALATTLTTTLTTEGERRSDEDVARRPDAAGAV